MIHNDWSTSPERKKANSYGGCGYYRIVKVAEQLKKEHDVTVWGREWEETYESLGKNNDMFFNQMARDYDVIWCHYTDNPITFSWLRTACDKHGTKLVMDIDDNFLEVDKKNPALKKQNKGKVSMQNKVAMLATILSFADAITVSTVPLKEKIYNHIKKVHGIEKNIFVVPNFNDINDWNYTPVPKKGLVIGYIGGLSHKEDLEIVIPAIKKILIKYKNVAFQMMGQMDIKEAKSVFGSWNQSLRNRLFLMNATKTQPEYPLYLSQQPWDIGIAPLIDSPFNECKSHIKWMEYSMYKIPVVASPVYPYKKDVLGIPTITDIETGVFANDDEWFNKLSMLIEDEKLRLKLGESAYSFVSKNWQYKDNKKIILDVANKIKALD